MKVYLGYESIDGKIPALKFDVPRTVNDWDIER